MGRFCASKRISEMLALHLRMRSSLGARRQLLQRSKFMLYRLT